MSLWYQAQLKEQTGPREPGAGHRPKFQYFQHMALANTAWRDGNMGRLEQLLDDCPVEHQDHWEWRYLKRQCHRELLKLEGHTGAIFEIKYSRDGKHMASASLDETVKLWDTATGQAPPDVRRPHQLGRPASPSARRTTPDSPRPVGTAP